jgi:hypothetical protein
MIKDKDFLPLRSGLTHLAAPAYRMVSQARLPAPPTLAESYSA